HVNPPRERLSPYSLTMRGEIPDSPKAITLGLIEQLNHQRDASCRQQQRDDERDERPCEDLAQAGIFRRRGHQFSPETVTKRPIRPQPPKLSVKTIARSLSPATSGKYIRA